MWLKELILFKLLCMACGYTKRDSTLSRLPVSDAQFEDLARSVCEDLTGYLTENCMEYFDDPDKILPAPQTGLHLRCHKESSITVTMKPSQHRYLVVLVPDVEPPDLSARLSYSIIDPGNKSIELYSTPDKQRIFATILTDNGSHSLWKEGPRIKKWVEPPHKEYEVVVKFENSTDDGKVDGVISWNHIGETDACFDFIAWCDKSGNIDMVVEDNTTPRVVFKNLHKNDSCKAKVIGKYGETKIAFSTPTSNVPETEENPTSPKQISIRADEVEEGWSVRVNWSQPRLDPDVYNVTLFFDNSTYSMFVYGNETEVTFTNVSGSGIYTVAVSSILGHHAAHTSRRAMFPTRIQSIRFRWASVTAVAGAWLAAAAAAAAALAWIRCRKPTKPHVKLILPVAEVKPLEETMTESTCESTGSDSWEVKLERVLLHEVLGEGAFGVVRRGTLAPTGKEVAVKMLKEFPSLEEMRAFHLEMEVMKSVGAHPHVVSLLGCCSGRRPLIIAEYCSRGDLLSFLRRSWDMLISKRHAKYYNNNDETNYRNDLFLKCKLRQEESRLVVNKLYDLQGCGDIELTALDLLSFCRQIAMGMEFLAANRLVHRDLAARNILVTGDKMLKIADFGLSRDVYEENQYKQKGNGKMPVKWMALESLTRRIYTTQSDVWSFGVVVWEIVTVGASPYPDVLASRLPRLLRAGYRMPRPNNCSKQLYDLMLSCWRARPRDRPTFTELHHTLDELLNCACDTYLSLELDDDSYALSTSHIHQRYFNMILRAKRYWSRGESYERPLRAPRSNHYSSPPASLHKT